MVSVGEIKDPAVEMRLAHELYQRWGRQFLADPSLAALLGVYQAAIDACLAAYQANDISEYCRRCGEEDHLACCFLGAEKWYGHRLLMLNMMLGAQIPEERELEGECFFMGTKGCKLMARCGICLNFFCPSLVAVLGQPQVNKLLKLVGRELWVSMEAEQRLANLILAQQKLSQPASA